MANPKEIKVSPSQYGFTTQQPHVKICENGMFKVYLTKSTDTLYVISVHEYFEQQTIKKWVVFNKNNKWYIKNHQFKKEMIIGAAHVGGNILDMEYEWVTYPIMWDTLDGLIKDFTEVSSNFTYFFVFPRE